MPPAVLLIVLYNVLLCNKKNVPEQPWFLPAPVADGWRNAAVKKHRSSFDDSHFNSDSCSGCLATFPAQRYPYPFKQLPPQNKERTIPVMPINANKYIVTQQPVNTETDERSRGEEPGEDIKQLYSAATEIRRTSDSPLF